MRIVVWFWVIVIGFILLFNCILDNQADKIAKNNRVPLFKIEDTLNIDKNNMIKYSSTYLIHNKIYKKMKDNNNFYFDNLKNYTKNDKNAHILGINVKDYNETNYSGIALSWKPIYYCNMPIRIFGYLLQPDFNVKVTTINEDNKIIKISHKHAISVDLDLTTPRKGTNINNKIVDYLDYKINIITPQKALYTNASIKNDSKHIYTWYIRPMRKNQIELEW